jgi:hypothetical protein
MSEYINKVSANKKSKKTMPMKKKIIYLSYIRLTDRVAKTWFMNHLVSSQTNVEYWDLVNFMRETHNEIYELKPEHLSEIQTFKELKKRISQESRDNTVFVILFPLNLKTIKVHRMLSKIKAKKVYIDWGAMPVYGESRRSSLIKKIWKNKKNVKAFKAKLSRTLLRIYQKSPFFERFDIVFTSGEILETNRRDAKKVTSLAFGDYTEFLIQSGKKNQRKKKSAVFLDINLPYQSDLRLVSLPSVNAEEYYSELNSFFSQLEKKFNLEVVIAAHPKTADKSKDFYGRDVYRMKTAELVRDAEFVISHQSTSISYAVLNYKPILFIYTSEMALLYKDSVVAEINYLANYFGIEPINISEEIMCKDNFIGEVNQHKYNQYIQNYIATEQSQKSNPKDVFFDEITNLLENRNGAR